MSETSLVSLEMYLYGERAGQTVTLDHKYHFVEGKLVIEGSDTEVNNLKNFLMLNWLVAPAGHPLLGDYYGQRTLSTVSGGSDLPGEAPGDVQSGIQPSGSGDTPPENTLDGKTGDDPAAGAAGGNPLGDGQQPPMTPAVERLLKLLKLLNPEDDTHWTRDGLPSLKAMETFGATGVTRADVNAVAPGFTRATATKE